MKQLDKIPFGLRIKTLFSSKLINLGLFLFLIPTILLITFLPNIDFKNQRYDTESKTDTKGILLTVRETNNSVNGKTALEYNYEFYIDNELINGQSYGFDNSIAVGDTVDIEYLKNDISTSRILGTKNGAFDIDTLEFILGFFIFGLIVLITPIYKRIEILKILKSGFEITPSKLDLELKTPTLPFGKSKPFYRLKFNYDISGYIYKKVIYVSRDVHTIRRIRRSAILVDSHNHSKSIVLEALPIKMINYINEKSTIANTQ